MSLAVTLTCFAVDSVVRAPTWRPRPSGPPRRTREASFYFHTIDLRKQLFNLLFIFFFFIYSCTQSSVVSKQLFIVNKMSSFKSLSVSDQLQLRKKVIAPPT